jgi:hypothetical protein
MNGSGEGKLHLRVTAPTLEPSEEFVAQLAEAASAARAAAPAEPRPTWQAPVAAAGVAAIVGATAWLADTATDPPIPAPPISPATPHSPDPDPAVSVRSSPPTGELRAAGSRTARAADGSGTGRDPTEGVAVDHRRNGHATRHRKVGGQGQVQQQAAGPADDQAGSQPGLQTEQGADQQVGQDSAVTKPGKALGIEKNAERGNGLKKGNEKNGRRQPDGTSRGAPAAHGRGWDRR